jgi:putative nucleotidyltransferase with HDIG domain
METNKIEKLEEEIKNLHYNPTITKHSFSDLETKEFFNTFWDIHIKPVIEYSKQMAEKYNADKEVVWLGAILHDVARLSDEEPHDKIGSEKAYKLLIERGFSAATAEKVKEVVLRHRVKENPPQTLEQKIVASADAMAHFLPPFYLWIGKYSKNNFAGVMEKNKIKIERDFNQKIFFDQEKKMVEKEYEMLKKWFDYNIN